MLQHLKDEHQNSPQNAPVHILVVTHGAYMRVVMRYMVEELHCSFHSDVDKSLIYTLCPNTGIIRYIFNVKCDESPSLFDIQCLLVNKADHITDELKK